MENDIIENNTKNKQHSNIIKIINNRIRMALSVFFLFFSWTNQTVGESCSVSFLPPTEPSIEASRSRVCRRNPAFYEVYNVSKKTLLSISYSTSSPIKSVMSAIINYKSKTNSYETNHIFTYHIKNPTIKQT